MSVVSDPTDPAAPGLGIREEIDACTGRVHITLTTLTHEIEVGCVTNNDRDKVTGAHDSVMVAVPAMPAQAARH